MHEEKPDTCTDASLMPCLHGMCCMGLLFMTAEQLLLLP